MNRRKKPQTPSVSCFYLSAGYIRFIQPPAWVEAVGNTWPHWLFLTTVALKESDVILQRELWVFLCKENPQKSNICSALGVYKSKPNNNKNNNNTLNEIPAYIRDPILPTSACQQLPWEELCLFPHSSHGDQSAWTRLWHICNTCTFITEHSPLQKCCAQPEEFRDAKSQDHRPNSATVITKLRPLHQGTAFHVHTPSS